MGPRDGTPEIIDDIKKMSSPLFLNPVSCTFSTPIHDSREEPLSLDEYCIKNPHATFFVKAEGDCMNPVIAEGDLLLIDRSLPAVHGKIVLVVIDGAFSVKRLFRELQKDDRMMYRLSPDNKKYKDIVIEEDQDMMIWGVVSFVIRKV
jgi:DNA polymerase V